jgi:gliding motility-associated-like protein
VEKLRQFSDADTQPGQLGVAKPPADGQSYVSLVVRGPDQFGSNLAGSGEAIGAFLTDTLFPGKTYTLAISLSNNADFTWEGVDYSNPCRLRVYIGNNECAEQQMIWLSQPIGHFAWQEYSRFFTPQSASTFIIFEAAFEDESDPKTGNLFLDAAWLRENIEEDEEEVPEDTSSVETAVHCNVFIPNAFSPNDDGINDIFIPHLDCRPDAFHMTVFDRWGGMVFESKNPDEGWDGRIGGKLAPAGLYAFFIRFRTGGPDGQVAVERGAVSLLR